VDFPKFPRVAAFFVPSPRRYNSLKVDSNAAPISRKATALEAVWLTKTTSISTDNRGRS
jgi:hypothetical protein